MAQLLQINPSVNSNGKIDFSVMPDTSKKPLSAMPDTNTLAKLEAELNEHRYYLERKVEQRTGWLMRRITLLEACNSTLCNKLAQARSEANTLRKQIALAQSGEKSNVPVIVAREDVSC